MILGIIKRFVKQKLKKVVDKVISKPTFWFDICSSILDYGEKKAKIKIEEKSKIATQLAKMIVAKMDDQEKDIGPDEQQLIMQITKAINTHVGKKVL